MEWWRSQEAKPTRDYFRVEDEAGQRFWLFRDGLYGEIRDADNQVVSPQWFVHGLFA
jgi:protein ImuB